MPTTLQSIYESEMSSSTFSMSDKGKRKRQSGGNPIVEMSEKEKVVFVLLFCIQIRLCRTNGSHITCTAMVTATHTCCHTTPAIQTRRLRRRGILLENSETNEIYSAAMCLLWSAQHPLQSPPMLAPRMKMIRCSAPSVVTRAVDCTMVFTLARGSFVVFIHLLPVILQLQGFFQAHRTKQTRVHMHRWR